MPSIPRVYRVQATYRNTEIRTRHYLTKKAAAERAARWEAGRPAALGAEALAALKASGGERPLDVPVVTITPSHRVTYPHAAGDAAQFDIPDQVAERQWWLYAMRNLFGVDPERILRIDVDDDGLRVEYRPDPPVGQRDTTAIEPKVWVVEFGPDDPEVTAP